MLFHSQLCVCNPLTTQRFWRTTYLQVETGSCDTTVRFWFKLASEASMQSTALFVTTFDHLLDAFPAKCIHGLNERLRKQSLPAPYLRRIKVLMPRCEPTTLVQKVASQCRVACVKRLRFLFGYGIPLKSFRSANVDDPTAVFSSSTFPIDLSFLRCTLPWRSLQYDLINCLCWAPIPIRLQ